MRPEDVWIKNLDFPRNDLRTKNKDARNVIKQNESLVKLKKLILIKTKQ